MSQTQKRTLLAIGAHPADPIDNAAGTLALHARAGDEVHIVALSHGGYSHATTLTEKRHTEGDRHGEKSISEISEIKGVEISAAGDILGVREVFYFGYEDQPLVMPRDAIMALAEKIREIKPDIVLCHHPNEWEHTDHWVAGQASVQAIDAAGRWFSTTRLPRHVVKAVYFYGHQFRPLQARLGFVPVPADVVVDIESVIDLKIDALCSYGTQKYQKETYGAWRKECLDGANGLIYGVRYAEIFIARQPLRCTLLPSEGAGAAGALIGKMYKEEQETP